MIGKNVISHAIEDHLEDCLERYKSCLLIPGGCVRQLDSINYIINLLKDTKLTVVQFHRHMVDHYNCTKHTAENTRLTLERANLIRRTRYGEMALTNDGILYAKTKDPMIVIMGFFEAYWGFWEMLQTINDVSQDGAANNNIVHYRLKNAFVKTFGHDREDRTHETQIKVISSYMRSFMIIKLDKIGGYQIIIDPKHLLEGA